MTNYEFLASLSGYPLGADTLGSICSERGVPSNEPFVPEVASGDRAFNLARADVYAKLAVAPSISENGVSFSFNAEQKEHFQKLANRLYRRFGEPESAIGDPSGIFGYKGGRL